MGGVRPLLGLALGTKPVHDSIVIKVKGVHEVSGRLGPVGDLICDGNKGTVLRRPHAGVAASPLSVVERLMIVSGPVNVRRSRRQLSLPIAGTAQERLGLVVCRERLMLGVADGMHVIWLHGHGRAVVKASVGGDWAHSASEVSALMMRVLPRLMVCVASSSSIVEFLLNSVHFLNFFFGQVVVDVSSNEHKRLFGGWAQGQGIGVKLFPLWVIEHVSQS